MESDLARASVKRSPVDFLAARAVKGSREAVRSCNHRIVSFGGWRVGMLSFGGLDVMLGNVASSSEMRRA